MKKSKQKDFVQLGMKHLNDNRRFWMIIKPFFFSDKAMNSYKKKITEMDELLSEKRSIAEVINNYFVNTSKSLNL